jgi:hypothetical protein
VSRVDVYARIMMIHNDEFDCSLSSIDERKLVAEGYCGALRSEHCTGTLCDAHHIDGDRRSVNMLL